MKIENMVNQVLQLLNGIAVLGVRRGARRQDWSEYCLIHSGLVSSKFATPAPDQAA
jgi:hypothetical protein